MSSSALGLHNFSLTYLSLHVNASKEKSTLHLPESLVYAAYILNSILAIMVSGVCRLVQHRIIGCHPFQKRTIFHSCHF